MTIGRLHIGVWRRAGKFVFVPYELLTPSNGCSCGCYMLTILGVCFTWLGDECRKSEFTQKES